MGMKKRNPKRAVKQKKPTEPNEAEAAARQVLAALGQVGANQLGMHQAAVRTEGSVVALATSIARLEASISDLRSLVVKSLRPIGNVHLAMR